MPIGFLLESEANMRLFTVSVIDLKGVQYRFARTGESFSNRARTHKQQEEKSLLKGDKFVVC